MNTKNKIKIKTNIINQTTKNTSNSQEKKSCSWSKINQPNRKQNLTFWPLGDNPLLEHCYSGRGRVAKRADIWSIIKTELELNQVFLRHLKPFTNPKARQFLRQYNYSKENQQQNYKLFPYFWLEIPVAKYLNKTHCSAPKKKKNNNKKIEIQFIFSIRIIEGIVWIAWVGKQKQSKFTSHSSTFSGTKQNNKKNNRQSLNLPSNHKWMKEKKKKKLNNLPERIYWLSQESQRLHSFFLLRERETERESEWMRMFII